MASFGQVIAMPEALTWQEWRWLWECLASGMFGLQSIKRHSEDGIWDRLPFSVVADAIYFSDFPTQCIEYDRIISLSPCCTTPVELHALKDMRQTGMLQLKLCLRCIQSWMPVS